MRTASAKVIADSIYKGGPRLTSCQVTFWRPVLAEVNTHCVLSRNSASSRAIPLSKQLEKVDTDPAKPVVWAAEQKGMQGGDEIESTDIAEIFWGAAAKHSAAMAAGLGGINVHKSIANRLLEPFLMHTAIITATAWDNFFHLRLDHMAQPELRVAAEAMKAAMDASTPKVLEVGQWHLPYVHEHEYAEIEAAGFALPAISSARTARVSYETQDGTRDFDKDQELYETLCGNGHASPLEHVATPSHDNQHFVRVPDAFAGGGFEMHLPKYGKFLGWHQHRFDMEAARGYQSFS